MRAILALENGSIYEGRSIGIKGEKSGWVTFYTGVVGYQEVMTNPANAGKIIVMTYPLIGNYGAAKKFNETKKCWINCMVIKEKSRIISNWQAEEGFSAFLKRKKVLAMEGVDTRTLIVELRNDGEQFGIFSTLDFNASTLKRKIKKAKNEESDFIKKISVKEITALSYQGLRTAILDIGVTNSFIIQLKSLGCRIKLLPYNTECSDLLKLSPKCLIISDGPEKDKNLSIVVDTVKQLLGKIPMFGLGTGCQVLAMAMGAKIERMHLGHHGLNYPVLKPNSLKGEITAQNHSYRIDEDSLKGKNVEITWRNINDQSVEGIRNRKLKVFGCQFYPASPGPGEANPVLREFIDSVTPPPTSPPWRERIEERGKENKLAS